MTEILYKGKFLNLVRNNNWEYVQRNASDVVIIIPVLGDAIFLIKEYREPLGKIVVGLPAGLVGDKPGQESEDIFAAARRELEEEIGWTSKGLELVAANLPSSPGLSDETFNLFIARGLTKVSEGGGDETEEIEPVLISIDMLPIQIEDWKKEGYSIDPKIYMALYFLGVEK